jgi:lipopolysaccharide biosynthesis regulator YciM
MGRALGLAGLRRWLQRLRRRLRRDPAALAGEASARLREALSRVLAGDLEGAELLLAEVARVDSSATDVYLALSHVYRARGEIGRAIQIHQNLLLRSELSLALRREALLGLALDFRAGGFLGRAAASLEEFLQADPRHLEALRQLERLHVDRGDWPAAIAVRRRIGSRDPDTARVRAHLWTGLARMQLAASALPEAQRSLRRALAADRSCADVYVAFGELRMREGKWRKAIDLYTRALPLHPRMGGHVYARLWEAYESESDVLGFSRLLAERSEHAPEDFDAQLWSARALVALGRADDGLAGLRRLIDRAPDYHVAYAEMGRMLLGQGRAEEAVKFCEELLSRVPSLAPGLRCSRCGAPQPTLRFRCPSCGAWDSIH